MSKIIASDERSDPESPESPREVVRAMLGQALLDDDGRELLPPLRAWSVPEGPITEEASLTFWAVSIVPSGDRDADRRAHAAAVERAKPAIGKALTAGAELARAEVALDRERGAGGGPRTSCPAAAWERLGAEQRAARARRSEALGDVLELGLRDRLGLPLLLGHRDAYTWLRACVGMPAGLAVCERCWTVFEPARKSHAYVCGPCHASPGRVPPLTAHKDDRGVSTVALPGGAVARWKPCAVCGQGFDIERAHQGECSPACKQRRKRRVKAGRPIRDARDHWWIDPGWDLASVRSANCADCGVEFATEQGRASRCPLCEDVAAGHDVYRPYDDRSRVEGWCGPAAEGAARPPRLSAFGTGVSSPAPRAKSFS